MSIADKYTTLTTEKIPNVYEAGKQAEYDKFWDNFQENGNRTHYDFAFYRTGWNNNNFKPKYLIQPKNGKQMFFRSEITRINVPIDCSQMDDLEQVFYYALNVTYIKKIIFRGDGSQTFTQTFNGCNVFRYIDEVEGKIGTSIHLGATALRPSGMKRFIKALVDYSGTDKELVYTISFGAEYWEMLEADSKPSDEGIEFDGTWKDYVLSLGWQV